MSSSMRPVKTVWGPHTSMFIDDPDQLVNVLRAATGVDISWDYAGWSNYCKIHIYEGKAFLAALTKMDVDRAVDIVDPAPEQRDDVQCLLTNLKALARDWKTFVEDDGSLEILAD